jgi:hypothetical protein
MESEKHFCFPNISSPVQRDYQSDCEFYLDHCLCGRFRIMDKPLGSSAAFKVAVDWTKSASMF